MRSVVASHRLLPKGLELESLSVESAHVNICAGSGATKCICPLCGNGSSRVHSRYVRTASDLPWHGICVTFKIRARRFFCNEVSCERKIFCERLEEVDARARKTSRLEGELGGRAGARLALEPWASSPLATPCSGGSRARPCRRLERSRFSCP